MNPTKNILVAAAIAGLIAGAGVKAQADHHEGEHAKADATAEKRAGKTKKDRKGRHHAKGKKAKAGHKCGGSNGCGGPNGCGGKDQCGSHAGEGADAK